MAFEVIFSKRADHDFENILYYIENEFGTQSAIRFKDLVIEFVALLQNFHEIGNIELPDKNIRSFVIHRRLKVFYYLKNNRIIIFRLFDTRQHPDKLL